MNLFDIPEEKLQRNPMVLTHGKTPGKKCKTCFYILSHERSRRWYKCYLRGLSHGKGTDHGCTWDACGMYKELIMKKICGTCTRWKPPIRPKISQQGECPLITGKGYTPTKIASNTCFAWGWTQASDAQLLSRLKAGLINKKDDLYGYDPKEETQER